MKNEHTLRDEKSGGENVQKTNKKRPNQNCRTRPENVNGTAPQERKREGWTKGVGSTNGDRAEKGKTHNDIATTRCGKEQFVSKGASSQNSAGQGRPQNGNKFPKRCAG